MGEITFIRRILWLAIFLFILQSKSRGQDLIIGVSTEKSILQKSPFQSLESLFFLRIESDTLKQVRFIHMSSEPWSTLLCCETDTTGNNIFDKIFELKSRLDSNAFELMNQKYDSLFKKITTDFAKMLRRSKRVRYGNKYVYVGKSRIEYCECVHLYANRDPDTVLAIYQIGKFSRINNRERKLVKNYLPLVFQKLRLQFLHE